MQDRRRWFALRSLRAKLMLAGLLLQAALLTAFYAVAIHGAGGVHGTVAQYLWFGAFLLLATALATWLVVSRLTHDLRRVQEAALELERGDLGARCGVHSRDELGSFGATFDRMADSVQTLVGEARTQDRRLALVQDAAGAGVWDWDIPTNYVYFSPQFMRLLGYAEEAEFRAAFMFSTTLHRDDRIRMVNLQRDYLARRAPRFDAEYRVRCRDGDYVWVHAVGIAQWDDSENGRGEAVRFTGSLTDITARRQAEQALRDSEERFALVAAVSNDGIWDWDFARDRHYLSSRLKAMMGFSDDELPSRREAFLARIHPEDQARGAEAVRRQFASGGAFDIEHRLVRKDGSHFWVRARGAAVRGLDGSVTRFCGALIDVSRERAATGQIRTLLDEQRAIFDNLLAGIVRLKDRRVSMCNPRYAEILGYTVDELVGTSVAVLYPDAAEAESTGAKFYRELAEHGSAQGEFCFRRKDGTLAWFIASGSALDREDPSRDSLWVVLDIGDRKRAETALRENEARFYHAVRGSSDAIWDWDLAAERYYMSPRMREMLGYGFGEPVADRGWFLGHLHEDDREHVEDGLRRHLESGEAYEMDYRVRARDGGVRWMRDRGRSVHDAQGTPVRFSGAISDISEIRALHEQLEQRVDERTAELTRANRELESFSYTVSHDLSAPLRAINGFSTLLSEELSGRLEPGAQHYLDRLLAGSVQMQALIDDLLRLAQVSRSRLVARAVDLAALAERVAADCAQEHAPRGVRFSAAPGLRARGDASLLRIALANLMGNAWKFTARNPAAEVEFGALEREGERVYFLRDNGAGFDMRHAAKLFKPFQRLHNTREFPGTGIGLAIVHRILERHGGRIWVESAPGAGTTFYFTLGT